MNGQERNAFVPRPARGDDREPELPVRLVPFHGQVPEPLVQFFGRLTPWTWRDLRTVFCRHPETRRLANILRTIDLVFEKAPHTLARGHWSISGYRDAREKIESAIMRLGHLASQVAADARVRLPIVPGRVTKPFPPRPNRPGLEPPRRPGVFQKFVGGMKRKFAGSSEAA
jgi:hypothetical protein